MHSPGEILPPFPKPTHSEDPGSGLIPRLSINQAISNIPEGWPNHNVEGAKVRNNPPVSGDRLAPTMTTKGSSIDHPSGERAMTKRENACLQGFPLEHKFGEFGVLQQIGNAVPPIVSEVLLREIKKALQKADGVDEDRA